MSLPFSHDAFLDVFAAYNTGQGLWNMGAVYLTGLVLYHAVRRRLTTL